MSPPQNMNIIEAMRAKNEELKVQIIADRLLAAKAAQKLNKDVERLQMQAVSVRRVRCAEIERCGELLRMEVELRTELSETKEEVERLKAGEASLGKRCDELLRMEVELRTELSEMKDELENAVTWGNFKEEKRIENHEAWLTESRRAEDEAERADKAEREADKWYTCVHHINAIALTSASPSALPVVMCAANKAIDDGHSEIACSPVYQQALAMNRWCMSSTGEAREDELVEALKNLQRVDLSDGNKYTKDQFIEFYGDEIVWNEAPLEQTHIADLTAQITELEQNTAGLRDAIGNKEEKIEALTYAREEQVRQVEDVEEEIAKWKGYTRDWVTCWNIIRNIGHASRNRDLLRMAIRDANLEIEKGGIFREIKGSPQYQMALTTLECLDGASASVELSSDE